MKKIKLKIPIYDVILEVWKGETEQEYVKQINKIQKDCLTEDGRNGSYVYFNLDKKNPKKVTRRILWIGDKEKIPTLLHEIFHAVCEILAYKNIHLVRHSDETYVKDPEEAYAYLLEYLYSEVIKKIQ